MTRAWFTVAGAEPEGGARVQLDGSQHDWFEGRREKAVLMVMVDDATNRTGARFFEEETTRASYDGHGARAS